ncbi:MAG: cupin domain-containing protein [Chitinispirillaceae bacterium]
MELFDLGAIPAYPLHEKGKNVFYRTEAFKARIVELPPGGAIPPCAMPQHVIFTVVKGEAHITVDGKTATAAKGCCCITEPATVSMKTDTGVRIMAIQIDANTTLPSGPRA